MMANNIRLSRISHPRATAWAVTLLVIVFLGFGLWAEAAIALNDQAATMTIPTEGWIAQISTALNRG